MTGREGISDMKSELRFQLLVSVAALAMSMFAGYAVSRDRAAYIG